MDISKNLVIVLVIVFVGGVGTAYAGVVFVPTITLDGNVEVTGELNCATCIQGFYEVSTSFGGFNGGDLFITVACDEGDEVISGGYTVNDVDTGEAPERSHKVNETIWRVEWANTNTQTTYTAIAHCADYSPVHIVV